LLPTGDPLTLERLGRHLDVTRERARQIETKVRQRLDPHGDLRRLVDRKLAAMRASRDSPLTVPELQTADPWFADLGSRDSWIPKVLHILGTEHTVDLGAAEGGVIAPGALLPLQRAVSEFKAQSGRQPSAEQLEESLRGFLADHGALELLPLFRTQLGDVVVVGDEVIFDARLVHRVEAVFANADGPLTIREAESRLRRAGIPFASNAVRSCLERIDVVRTGASEYIHAPKLSEWLQYEAVVEAEIRPLMEAGPDRQWSTRDLLGVLHDEGHDWAESLPAHALEFILSRDEGPFARLGRGMWALADSEAGEARVKIVDVCAAILRQAGAPLEPAELERRVRRVRSVSQALPTYWPLVHLEDGRMGLGPRDLGIPHEAFETIRSQLDEVLRTQGRISAGHLAQIVRSEIDEPLATAPWILARAFRANSRILLDGDGRGDGLRRDDVPRIGQRSSPSPATGTTEAATEPERQRRTQAEGGSTADALARVLAELEGDTSLEGIEDLLRGHGQRVPPRPALRMKLRLAGWRERDGTGRWMLAEQGS
jgi:hypothetical protein